MIETVGRSTNSFWKSSRSNKGKDHTYDLKPEHVRVCEKSDYNTLMDLQRDHINYGVCRTNSALQINHEPPDRVRRQGHEAEQTDTTLLNAKITTLQEALLLEQEKNRTLEHELSEIRRNIRMLNTGSKTLGKILRMDKTLVVLADAKKQNKEIAIVSRLHIHYCEGRASPYQYHPRWREFMFDILGHGGNMIGKEFVNFKRTYIEFFWSKPVQRDLLLEHSVKRTGCCLGDCLWGKRELQLS
ncbi:hypothetical protein F2Q70_00030429 [Brassica cretica]|nr:hypothetical protein F2Q70_00030429 [Brassica cretica]KAF2550649.1 hypothetical protein F2Q68_00034880 [Brassica cretica]